MLGHKSREFRPLTAITLGDLIPEFLLQRTLPTNDQPHRHRQPGMTTRKRSDRQ